MQDLEELGLIYAPHASAGRLPTQQGLRLFVDALLEFGDLGREERARIDSQVRAAAEGGGFEGALAETTSLLSELTRGAGVVLTSKTDARLKHVEFVRLESDRALAILVAEDGSIENRVVATPPGMPASALRRGQQFSQRPHPRPHARRGDGGNRGRAARRAARNSTISPPAWSKRASPHGPARGGSRDQLIVRGQANLLGDVRASEDLERIRTLFADLETKTDVIELLHRAETGDGVKIFIGSENKLFSLVRIVDDRRAAQGQRPSHCRRARRHRADAAQLRPHRADGRICRAGARRAQAPALGRPVDERLEESNVERVERRDLAP